MNKRSTILRNWPKYLLQWGVLAAIILFMTGLISSEKAVDPEAYCPMGGLQALATYLANNSLPCSMSSLQVMMGSLGAQLSGRGDLQFGGAGAASRFGYRGGTGDNKGSEIRNK